RGRLGPPAAISADHRRPRPPPDHLRPGSLRAPQRFAAEATTWARRGAPALPVLPDPSTSDVPPIEHGAPLGGSAPLGVLWGRCTRQPPRTAATAASSAVSGRIPRPSTKQAAITSAVATYPERIGVAKGAPGFGSRMYMNTSTFR